MDELPKDGSGMVKEINGAGTPNIFLEERKFKAVCNGYMGLDQGNKRMTSEAQLQIRISSSGVYTGEVRGH